MERGDDLQAIRRSMSRQNFLDRTADLLLIRELNDDERGFWTYETQGNAPRPSRRPTGEVPDIFAGGTLSVRLTVAPGYFGLHPLAKSAGSSWGTLLTVGRASKNDIILDHESVSKFHACFQRDDAGGWGIKDNGSTNGTTVDGQPVPSDGRFVPVKGGMAIRFGLCDSELISAADLFDALGP